MASTGIPGGAARRRGRQPGRLLSFGRGTSGFPNASTGGGAGDSRHDQSHVDYPLHLTGSTRRSRPRSPGRRRPGRCELYGAWRHRFARFWPKRASSTRPSTRASSGHPWLEFPTNGDKWTYHKTDDAGERQAPVMDDERRPEMCADRGVRARRTPEPAPRDQARRSARARGLLKIGCSSCSISWSCGNAISVSTVRLVLFLPGFVSARPRRRPTVGAALPVSSSAAASHAMRPPLPTSPPERRWSPGTRRRTIAGAARSASK